MGYGVTKVEPWWVLEARREQQGQLDDGTSCSSWMDAPCGGCGQCLLAQEYYYWSKGFAEPKWAANQFGLGFWPVLMLAWIPGDTFERYPEFHDRSHWMTPGQCNH